MTLIPEIVPNLIAGREFPAASGAIAAKLDPATGGPLCALAASDAGDVDAAVKAAARAFAPWAATPPVQRGMVLHRVCQALAARKEDVARVVAAETGKSFRDALGETEGTIALGLFYAGEGQRLFGRTATSATVGKHSMVVRQPVGVAGLIVAANTPIANAAWKVFPALICGNAAVLKAAEDAPATAWLFGRILGEHLPAGVLNVIQGLGREAGAPLAAHPGVGVVSFTGSTVVGREIAEVAGRRLAKVSLELGGKNALVVCDDADLDKAVRWTALSAFSNAGQRCASASRVIVFDAVYDDFRNRLVKAAQGLRLGTGDEDDLGPVINRRSLDAMTRALGEAVDRGARVLAGGVPLDGPGCYMLPTVVEGVAASDPLSAAELFGPIACLYRVADCAGALALANDSPYGLTAAIHTRDLDRAWTFAQGVETGVVNVNGGTYGSEPHMPFGGRKLSGNGAREPGPEGLDVYSELKCISFYTDPEQA